MPDMQGDTGQITKISVQEATEGSFQNGPHHVCDEIWLRGDTPCFQILKQLKTRDYRKKKNPRQRP